MGAQIVDDMKSGEDEIRSCCVVCAVHTHIVSTKAGKHLQLGLGRSSDYEVVGSPRRQLNAQSCPAVL